MVLVDELKIPVLSGIGLTDIFHVTVWHFTEGSGNHSSYTKAGSAVLHLLSLIYFHNQNSAKQKLTTAKNYIIISLKVKWFLILKSKIVQLYWS